MSSTVWVNYEYEHDDRWTAVDAYGAANLQNKNHDFSETMDEILKHIEKRGIIDDSTYPAFGKFLALHARSIKAKHVLEVGLLGGYTAIWIALHNPEARVTSLEINEYHAQVAKENGERAGVADRMEIVVGPATETFKTIKEEILSGKRPKFDFTFIDADKENNWAYFDFAAGLSISGAPIVVDNVIRKGWIILPEHTHQPPVAGAREVIEKAGADPRVESCLMQTVSEKNYDGFLYAIVK